jgi:hypothetical protein
MDNTIIIILGIILLVLIILNNITIVRKPITTKASCTQTVFGCCPDGVNSKINFYGTNCPNYKPEPKPISGCIGTKYGCCPKPFGKTPKMDEKGSNCVLK